jgi:hypothetical protein
MQWEYKIYRELPEDRLNSIGGEGWEIIEATFSEEEGVLSDVLAKRGRGGQGGGGGGRGGGRGGRGGRGRKGPRIGVMGGTSIGDKPGY